mmetsp:Transcript_91127/g.221273  ORF Transcript_91127/g.221273 Transcript_91127/m.221273 type:complete len:290 (+) Transcript_91127:189-1058(+)
MHVEVVAARHFPDRHMLRQLLKLQNLLIGILANIVHDDEGVRRASFQLPAPRVAIARGWDVRSGEAGIQVQRLHVLTTRALEHKLARLVPRLPHGRDNPLDHHELLHLHGGQLADHHGFHRAESALQIDVAVKLQLNVRNLGLRVRILLHKLTVQILERPLAEREEVRRVSVQLVREDTIFPCADVVEIQLQVVVARTAVLLELVAVSHRAHIDAAGAWRAVGKLPDKLLELRRHDVRLYVQIAVHSRGVPRVRALDEPDGAILREHGPELVGERVWPEWGGVPGVGPP